MIEMKKIYLINFSLMERIADKKNGITTEDATAYITGVELFFVFLVIEFLIMSLLPFQVSNYLMFGVMALIWYYTHYVLRKSIGTKLHQMGLRKLYKDLSKSKQTTYLVLSILVFFIVFLFFFAASVWTIGGYDKRWE
jgi:succinate dehydrogenase hydrophobic anchor subunit